MGFRFWKQKRGAAIQEVSVQELLDEAAELKLQQLAFETCANMVGSALGLCEFRTFVREKEVFDTEYYVWNVEPNTNQNSTMFLHKLVSVLYERNEALIIPVKKNDKTEGLLVADSWSQSDQYPKRENEYRDVCVEQYQYKTTFRERDVIHLRLHNDDVSGLVSSMANKYARLIDAFESFYNANRGNRWKVKTHMLAPVEPGSEEEKEELTKFQSMVKNQFKPFVTHGNALLPEPDGYEFSKIPSQPMGVDGSTELRNLTEDVFNYTARAFGIPVVLINGKVEATADANKRFLSNVIDPICDQLQEEITRKRYGLDAWKNGNKILVDSSGIIHFDPFEMSAQVEKLIGSGFYTINDVRRVAGQPEIQDEFAKTFYMTKNFATANEIKKGESEDGN